jgi:hypothetical protein
MLIEGSKAGRKRLATMQKNLAAMVDVRAAASRTDTRRQK